MAAGFHYNDNRTFEPIHINVPRAIRLACDESNSIIANITFTNERNLPQISQTECLIEFEKDIGNKQVGNKMFAEKLLDEFLFGYNGGVEGAKSAKIRELEMLVAPLRGAYLNPAQIKQVVEMLDSFYMDFRNQFYYGITDNANPVCHRCGNYYHHLCVPCYEADDRIKAHTPGVEEIWQKAVGKFVCLELYPPILSFPTFAKAINYT